MNTTLLIMAAGIGSRFGTGIKQLEPVDDAGHIMSTSYVSYTKPIFEVIKIPKILEKSSFFACVESKCVI